jgi:hypothetical protein
MLKMRHRPVPPAPGSNRPTAAAHGESSLIIGTQLNPEDWDGMGKQLFFISSINGDAIPEIISSARCTKTGGPLCGSISCHDGAADPESGDHALL